MRPVRWLRVIASGAAAFSGSALFAAAMIDLRINLSPSVPIGLYVAERAVSSASKHVDRGWLVEVCLPEEVARWGHARGYLTRGSCADGLAPVGKAVFAVAGDTVSVSAAGLGIGQVVAPNTRALTHDFRGRPLAPVGEGRHVVAPGEVWLVSTYSAASWDSRYYGPVSVTRVIARLRPVWVTR